MILDDNGKKYKILKCGTVKKGDLYLDFERCGENKLKPVVRVSQINWIEFDPYFLLEEIKE